MIDLDQERPPWEAAFAASVAEARERAGFSAETLAQRVRTYGLAFYAHHVEAVESGTQPISLNEALVICKVLQLELPEVTASVQSDLVTQAYAREVSTAERAWFELKNRLGEQRRSVRQALDGVRQLRDGYQQAVEAVDGAVDAELIATVDLLDRQVATVLEAFDAADRDLDGALWGSSTRARLPGSQN